MKSVRRTSTILKKQPRDFLNPVTPVTGCSHSHSHHARRNPYMHIRNGLDFSAAKNCSDVATRAQCQLQMLYMRFHAHLTNWRWNGWEIGTDHQCFSWLVWGPVTKEYGGHLSCLTASLKLFSHVICQNWTQYFYLWGTGTPLLTNFSSPDSKCWEHMLRTFQKANTHQSVGFILRFQSKSSQNHIPILHVLICKLNSHVGLSERKWLGIYYFFGSTGR